VVVCLCVCMSVYVSGADSWLRSDIHCVCVWHNTRSVTWCHLYISSADNSWRWNIMMKISIQISSLSASNETTVSLNMWRHSVSRLVCQSTINSCTNNSCTIGRLTDVVHCVMLCWPDCLLLLLYDIRNFESNRIVTSLFDSIWYEYNYSKFSNTYHRQHLTQCRQFFTLATTPSNQQHQCYISPFGPPSTETPTTETTTLRCHKNGWIYLTSTYYWWLLRLMITIDFDSKFQIIAQLFDSKWKNTICTALVVVHCADCCA